MNLKWVLRLHSKVLQEPRTFIHNKTNTPPWGDRGKLRQYIHKVMRMNTTQKAKLNMQRKNQRLTKIKQEVAETNMNLTQKQKLNNTETRLTKHGDETRAEHKQTKVNNNFLRHQKQRTRWTGQTRDTEAKRQSYRNTHAVKLPSCWEMIHGGSSILLLTILKNLVQLPWLHL